MRLKTYRKIKARDFERRRHVRLQKARLARPGRVLRMQHTTVMKGKRAALAMMRRGVGG